MKFQQFRPAGLTPGQTLMLYLRLKAQRRYENAWLNLIVTVAFMWILVIARWAYQLTQ